MLQASLRNKKDAIKQYRAALALAKEHYGGQHVKTSELTVALASLLSEGDSLEKIESQKLFKEAMNTVESFRDVQNDQQLRGKEINDVNDKLSFDSFEEMDVISVGKGLEGPNLKITQNAPNEAMILERIGIHYREK